MASLTSCTPKEAAEYLLHDRYKNDKSATKSFLTKALDHLNSISQETKNTPSSSSPESMALGNIVKSLPNPSNDDTDLPSSVEISATTPRGKFELEVYQHGIRLQNKKKEVMYVHSHQIEHVTVFPKPEDCKRQTKSKKSSVLMIPGSMVLITFKNGEIRDKDEAGTSVMFKNKPLQQICFQLPSHESKEIPDEKFEDASPKALANLCVDSYEEDWMKIFKSSLGQHVGRALNPQYHSVKKKPSFKFAFRSDEGNGSISTTSGGLPFVKCYSGVNDGVLFPLEEGLLFFKPPQFIHRSKLHSISCGRGSGTSSYVDIVAVLDAENDEDKCTKEFNNIDREEVRVMNEYINGVLVKAMARDAAEEDDGKSDSDVSNDEKVVSVQGSSSDVEALSDECEAEVISDDDDDSDSEAKAPKKRKRRQRVASKEAREATKLQLQNSNDQEDDEDDDNFMEEDDSSDDGSESESTDDEDETSSDSDGDKNPSSKRTKR